MILIMKLIKSNIFSLVPHGDVRFDVEMLPLGK